MQPVKDILIKAVAEQMELPQEMVHAIVSFQGEDAAKAAHVHQEIEFSGFGKFLLSQPRLKKRIFLMEKKLEEGRVTEENMEKYLKYLEEIKGKVK